jgi:benzoyl-CoA reductase/2-hydroxyglutaryl-CoA dehydratase subunit BcrC/BadD/HgdB
MHSFHPYAYFRDARITPSMRKSELRFLNYNRKDEKSLASSVKLLEKFQMLQAANCSVCISSKKFKRSVRREHTRREIRANIDMMTENKNYRSNNWI